MTPKRRIARRWTDEEISRFAAEPALKLADALAQELGGAIAALWYAKHDDQAEDEIPGLEESVDLGQSRAPLPG